MKTKKILMILMAISLLVCTLSAAENLAAENLAAENLAAENSVAAEKSTSSFLSGSGEYFALSWVADSIIFGASLSLDITDIILDKVVKLNRIEWTSQALDIQSVNAFDRSMMCAYNRAFDITSDFFAAASMVFPAVLFAAPMEEWFTIGIMYAESLTWAFGIKELLKLTVARTRPYMYFDDYPYDDVIEGKWNLSFPSGHTTYAFTGAAFSTYVFCKYFPSSPWRYAVGFGSYALAAATAAFRISSGSHFATDVIAGAAIGTACGFVVPFIHALIASSSQNPKTKKGEIEVAENLSLRLSPLGIDFAMQF
ncbi:MAG: phosphatase PAP2 family protein [Treponemataceae bacterium]|nr:phosphatase PAP2 family protein [Treponemataceae bacterium]